VKIEPKICDYVKQETKSDRFQTKWGWVHFGWSYKS